MSVSFLLAGDGVLNLIVNGRSFQLRKDDPTYQTVKDALKANRSADHIEKILNPPITIVKAGKKGNITIQKGMVLFNGVPIQHAVGDRILAYIKEKLPHKPLMKLLQHIYMNKWNGGVDGILAFLENKCLPITEDGYFIGYKSVRPNYKDWYTGQYDNSVGKTVREHDVDTSTAVECSNGLHVGNFKYASTFNTNGHLMLVKVNPKDVVSVPIDAQQGKIRVCEYTVIGEVDYKGNPLPNTLYKKDGSPLRTRVKSTSKDLGHKPDGRAYHNYRVGGKFAKRGG